MTKILILITTDRFSSPARLVVQNIEHRDRNRFTMLIGCTWQGGSETSEFFQEVKRRGLSLRILPQRGSLDPSPIFSLIRLVRQDKIDLVETHGSKACFIGFFLALFTRKPWVTVMHGHTAENRKVKVYAWIELRLAQYCDRIVTVSTEMRSRLIDKGLPAAKTVTIPNAIDPAQFTAVGEAANRAVYGIAENEFLIGVVGRFSPEKGQDLFVEAFKLMSSSHTSAKVIFLGEGPTEAKIRALVQKLDLESRVIFAGYQSHITSFYPLLNMVVMPSRSEGLPSVALEALYYRIPVVATEVGGTGEVIINEKTGLLVPAEDPQQLSAAIIRLMTDDALQKRVSVEGYDWLRENFFPEARVKAFEALYEKLGDNQ